MPMLSVVLISLSVAALPPAPAQAADSAAKVCVKLYDDWNRPTPHQVCRTAEQWKKILANYLGPPERSNPFQISHQGAYGRVR
jgi:hypothetical protein